MPHATRLMVAFMLISLFVSMFCTPAARGAEDSWKHPYSGWFDVDSNWSEGSAPASGDSVRFAAGGSYQVWWDVLTGNRSTQSVSLTDGDVTFRVSPGIFVWTIHDTASGADVSILGGRLTLGLAGYSPAGQLHLNVDDRLTIGTGGVLSVLMGNSVTTTTAMVGSSGSGTLAIASGGQVNSFYGLLGSAENTDGIATVRGTGSTWQNASSLYVGYRGCGTLTVSDGGYVYDKLGVVGMFSGSSGSATVSGQDSIWRNLHNLYLGGSDTEDGGTGSLEVVSGGRVFVGSVDPAAVAIGSGSAIVVSDSQLNGNMLVRNGSAVVNSGSAYLGYAARQTGSATVIGEDTSWANSGNLIVGQAGTGNLTITEGGQVSSGVGIIAAGSGSVGHVTIDSWGGPTSAWSSSGDLVVGMSGAGSLTLANGGKMVSGNACIAMNPGSIGTVDISNEYSTGFSVWQCRNLFVGGGQTFDGGTATLLVGYDGTLMVGDGDIGPFGGGILVSDSSGTGGNLVVRNGAYLTGGGVIGLSANESGAVTVTGAGTTWEAHRLAVGQYGNGKLTISNGGRVTSGIGLIAPEAGSTGSVTVSGTGSVWEAASITISESGTMLVKNSGLVTDNGYSFLFFGEPTGSTIKGNVRVEGTGSTYAVQRGGLDVTPGATLAITNGGKVICSSYTYTSLIGLLTGDAGDLDGNVTVDGNGSALIALAGLHPLNVGGVLGLTNGAYGEGSIRIRPGGSFSVDGSGSAWAGNVTVNEGANVLIVNGGEIRGTGSFSGFGVITIDGPGSAWRGLVTVGAGRNVRVRDGGQIVNQGDLHLEGTLTVADGGHVEIAALYASFSDLYGNGFITVSKGAVLDTNLVFDSAHGLSQTLPFGVGGILNLTVDPGDSLGAGYKDAGTLTIADGAAVASRDAYLGYLSNSAGTAAVTGAGSHWIIADCLRAGRSGSGALNIEAGGQVSNVTGIVGDADGSNGVVTVVGMDSKWTNADSIQIGRVGRGTLNIEAGGQVTSNTGCLGYANSGNGSVTVTGADSTWTNGGDLIIGRFGHGALSISDGGTTSNATGYLGYLTGGRGTAFVTGGAKWINSGTLHIGHDGVGVLTVADGAQVSATNISVRDACFARFVVSGNDMLVLGSDSTAGSVTNNGWIEFYANAFLKADTYTPVSELKGRAMTWSGWRNPSACGGEWSVTDKTFAVPEAVALWTGEEHAAMSNQRYLFTDPASGSQAGLSLGSITGSHTVSAAVLGQNELSSLVMIGSGEIVSAWGFSTTVSSMSSGMLAFDIGTGHDNLQVWFCNDGLWQQYQPTVMLYDSSGVLSFSTTNLCDGWAVTNVPEPCSALLLMLGAAALSIRHRRGRRIRSSKS